MYGSRQRKEVLPVDRAEIGPYLRRFLYELVKQGKRFEVRTLEEADRLKDLINVNERDLFIQSLRSINGERFWTRQAVTWIRSNLGYGKGVIFYFVCNSCYRKTKYLYFLHMTGEPLCRSCCGMEYKQSNRKVRALSRIAHKPYLSSEDKYTLLRRLGITRDDIETYAPLPNNNFATRI